MEGDWVAKEGGEWMDGWMSEGEDEGEGEDDEAKLVSKMKGRRMRMK